MKALQLVSVAVLCWCARAASFTSSNCSVAHLSLSGQNDISGTWETQVDDIQMNVTHQTNSSYKNAWSYGEWELKTIFINSNCTSQKTGEEWNQSDWNYDVIVVDVNSPQNETHLLTSQEVNDTRAEATLWRTTPPTVTYPGYWRFPDLGLYKLHTDRLSWSDARDACDAEQAYLAVVNSQREAEALGELFLPHDPTVVMAAYVGLSDHQSEGHFVSVLGEQLEVLGYNQWDEDQPDGRRGEDCVVISWLGLLSDESCDALLPFVCEAWLMY